MAQDSSVYRSREGRAEVLRLYDQALRETPMPVRHRDVDTRFGRTHVLSMGAEDCDPVVLFQGGNFLGPLTLSWFGLLADRFTVHAPDTVGHPGRSAEVRLSPLDESYGAWAADVLDGLALERVRAIGLSYGAGILLRLAAMEPERIERAVFLLPAGLARPRILEPVLRLAIPMLAYRLAPDRSLLEKAIRPLFTEEPHDEWTDALGAIFRHVRLEARMPRLATADEMSAFRAPTMVVASADDPFFPANRVLPKAAKILPHAAAVRLEGERHLLSDRGLRRVNEIVTTFFGDRSDHSD